MSLTDYPRLYFSGQMWWAPTTMNNNDYAPPLPTYDIAKAELNKPFLDTQLVENEEEFKKWVIKPTRADLAPDQKFVTPPAEWGYYGGNQCGFVTETSPNIKNPDFGLPPGRPTTAVSGFTNANGDYVQGANAWEGLPIQLNLNTVPCKMVDVNPQLPWATQLFADTFTVGSEASGQGFTSAVRKRMCTRNLYQHTYDLTNELMIAGKYSVVFQNCLHKDDIEFFDSNPDPNSFQAQIQAAMQDDDVLGVMIRVTAYDTYYFQGPAFDGLSVGSSTGQVDNRNDFMNRLSVLYKQYEVELRDYKLGKRADKPNPPVNRAYSFNVGWIGLWRKGELTNTPGGRMLIPYENPATYDSEIYVQPKDLPASYYEVPGTGEQAPAEVSLGPTMIEVAYDADSVSRISVDLGSTVPLTDVSGWRAEFGNVTLGLINPDQSVLSIANLPYYKDDYLLTSGVVDVNPADFLNPVTADQVRASQLVLQVDSFTLSEDGGEPVWTSTPTVALRECPLTAETDDRGIYLNEPGAPWTPPPPEFTVHLWHHDGPIPPGTQLAVAQYTPEGSLIPIGSKTYDKVAVALSYQDANGDFQPIYNDTTIPVPVDTATVLIRAEGQHPGLPNIRFYPIMPGATYGGPIPGGPMFYTFYTAARVLPFHNGRADSFEQWLLTNPDIHEVNQRVFNEVYGAYHMMYPVMNFINSPMKLQEWRGKILAITDPALFESARYMPVTRAMSAGQRHILDLWTGYLSRVPHPTQKKNVSNKIGK